MAGPILLRTRRNVDALVKATLSIPFFLQIPGLDVANYLKKGKYRDLAALKLISWKNTAWRAPMTNFRQSYVKQYSTDEHKQKMRLK
eukprot:6172077-Pleurochrysis_carterae.AAC.1